MTNYFRSGKDIDRGLVGYWPLNDLRRVSSDGIIAHFKMNDNSANTVVIDSKSGNNLTSQNSNTTDISATGKINESLSFDGANEYLLGTVLSQLSKSKKFSLGCWIKTADTSQDASILNNIISTSDRVGLTIIGNKISSGIYNGSDYFVHQVVAFTSNDWSHLMITYNGSDTLKLYVDGSLTTDIGGTPGLDSDLFFSAGARTSGNNKFTGDIDDIRAYDRELSLAEVQTIFNSDSGTETTELFRETIVARDLAKFNDGTITGCTATTDVRGKTGGATFFDGVDDKVSMGNIDISRNHEQLSCFCWVNTQSTGDQADNEILGDFDVFTMYTAQDASNNSFYVYLETEDKLWSLNRAGLSGNGPELALPNGVWKHVGFTYKSGEFKLYVGGQQVGTTATAWTGLTGTSSNDTLFGATDFHGSLAKGRIYNRVLTSSQINKLFKNKL